MGTRLGFGASIAQDLFDLSRHGEAAGLFLGEDQVVAADDLEDAAGAAHELGFDAEFPLEIRRQTGGARIVVSHRAVFDPHMGHGLPPFVGRFYDRESVPAGRPCSTASCRTWTIPGCAC